MSTIQLPKYANLPNTESHDTKEMHLDFMFFLTLEGLFEDWYPQFKMFPHFG